MRFPVLSEASRIERLHPQAGKVRIVLDTDTYNEIDDQFAMAYALRSPEHLDVEAIHAAPFLNNRSTSPGDGMEKSYEEILRVLDKLEVSREDFVFRGADRFLPDWDHPMKSPATEDLIARATASEEPLYVVAIGAITNVASALLMEPRLVERIVVVWLGGQPLHWPSATDFNLGQDVQAAQVVFDSGVPLVHVPCWGVASHLLTTVPEMERHVAGSGAIGDYLATIFAAYCDDHFGWSKVIWDIATIGYLINAAWVPTELVHSPILTDQGTWSIDHSRHLIRVATYVHRDPIFRDLFTKLRT